MKILARVFSFALLLRVSTDAGQVDRENEGNDAVGLSKKKAGFSFLERAVQGAKRVGATFDPDTVAHLEQAWKGLQPDLQEAAKSVLERKQEFQTIGKEAERLWSDMQRAVSDITQQHEGGGSERQGDEEMVDTNEVVGERYGSGLKPVKPIDISARPEAAAVKKAVRGMFTEVLTELSDEFVSAFEILLSDFLSEGSIRDASQLWNRVLNTPGVKSLSNELQLLDGAKRVVLQYLDGYMSEESTARAKRAINATADFTLHFAGLEQNAGRPDDEVFQEITAKLCHLQGAVVKLWPLTSHALPFVGYGEYTSSIESAIRANALSRITLTTSASALLGLNPSKDPFLIAVIASFSLGHLSKDVAQNMAASFQKVFMNDPAALKPPISEEQGSSGDGGALLMTPADLVKELLSGTSTCEELGRQSFAFFEAVERVLAEMPSCGKDKAGANCKNIEIPNLESSGPPLETRTSPKFAAAQKPPRPARKLEKDGLLLQLVICVAAFVENSRFSLYGFLICLGVGAFLCCAFLGVCCWMWFVRRFVRERGGRSGEAQASAASDEKKKA